MRWIEPLAAGPLDIVGDVHGELTALEALLGLLGYGADGRHPEGRRLVFVGDLVDRGPDSPGVLELVRALVEADRAQCILGNHELNILREVAKHGNAWWVDPEAESEHPAVRPTPPQKRRLKAWLETLPLALEREDLRVVHACWHADSLARLAADAERYGSVVGLYRHYVDAIRAEWSAEDVAAEAAAERARHGDDLADPAWTPRVLPAIAHMDVSYQMQNPVRVLTSGVEAPTAKPFWASGKWRMVTRIPWWDAYEETTPVVIGHYWRRYSDAQRYLKDEYGPDLFADVEPHSWMGARDNVYCVDFSVGSRAHQRAGGLGGLPETDGDDPAAFHGKLAALRVPEWEVVHDDGAVWKIGAPGAGPAGSRAFAG
jgi:hypothetical protein